MTHGPNLMVPGGSEKAWPRPPIFGWIQQRKEVDPQEMLRVFNCGIGMVLVVPAANGSDVKRRLDAAGEDWREIGTVVPGSRRVRYA